MRRLILVSLVLASLPAVVAGEPGADVILRNGKVWTVNPERPEVAAVAVLAGRIVAAGSDDDMRPFQGPKTRLIDLAGRRVVPGFHDSHVHLLSAGRLLSQVDLRSAADEAEFGRRLRAFDQKLPRDHWLLGGDWDHDRTFAGKLPSAELLDRYVPDRPAFLRRYDGHMAVVNSRALRLAGIRAETADPSGGTIDRKPDSREPSGVLRDNAMGLVSVIIPAPTDGDIESAVLAALGELRRHGVTSVQDMEGSGGPVRRALLRLYQRLAHSGRLTVRIRLYAPLTSWSDLAQVGVEVGFGDDWVQIGSLKDFMDGSLGSSTAKMFQPYQSDPSSTGLFVRPRSKLQSDIAAADRAGLAVAVHGIGDRANAELLDVFAEVAATNGPRDRRFRIEHVQHVRMEEMSRFAKLGVVASMQPYHAIDDGRWAEGRIGPERCATSYAFRSLLDAGARVAFGSDWPVAPVSPLLGIDAAVNRRTLDGKHPGGWFPAQRITVAEAIEAYTRTAAYAAFRERELGTLEPGKLADLVVLSRDILAPAERDQIAQTEVLLTMVGGRIVYEKRP